MAWKLSVCEYFYKTSSGKKFVSTINGNHALGVTVVAYNGGGAQRLFMKGDIVKLGPSTSSDNSGKYEFVRVSSVTDTNFTFLTSTIYAYLSTDTIEGIATGLPNDFSYNVSASAYVIEPLGIAAKFGTDGILNPAVQQRTGAPFFTITTVGGGATFIVLSSSAQRRQLLPSTLYRLGLHYRVENSVAGTISQFRLLRTGATAIIAIEIHTDNTVFTKAENTGTAPAVPGTGPHVDFIWFQGADFSLFAFDTLYVTHASMSSGSAAGVYSFPFDPVQVVEIESPLERKVRTQFGTDYRTGPLNVAPNRGWKLQFADADQEFIRELSVFEYWQNIGYVLMLESDITDVPPMFGYMKFNQASRHWDDTRLAINFEFIGIV